MHVEAVPFARHRARCTRDFDDLVAWLATKADKTTITRLLRIDWQTIGRIIERVGSEHLTAPTGLASCLRSRSRSPARGHGRRLGILADEQSAPALLLTRHGLTLAAAREAVAAMFADQPLPPPGKKTLLTPHAAITVQRARSATLRHGIDEVDPARLLHALIDNSGAAAMLAGAGVDEAALRRELDALLES